MSDAAPAAAGLVRHVRACNAWDPGAFLPFRVGADRVGWVRRDFARSLAAFPAIFTVGEDAVALHRRLESFAERSEAMAWATRKLVADGALRAWRGEWFAACAEGAAEPLFRVDRGALARFGIRAEGVHLNGYVRRPDGLHFWIARRAPDKMVDPDKLDNIVAGGMPFGLGPWETLVKESQEEASLGAELVARAVPVGAVTYRMERENGLRDDVLYLYDLELPETVTPRPNDDEIVAFERMPAGEALRLVRETDAFKFNVNLTLIDAFLRHGLIGPDEADYLEIVKGLRR